MSSLIPNQFHFVFGLKEQNEPFHLAFYLCIESCLQVNKPDKIFFYYHYEPFGRYWELLKEKITPVQMEFSPNPFQSKYKEQGAKEFSYAHHADFIRLEKLISHGGIYADIDTIFVNTIPDHLYSKPFVLGREIDLYDPSTKQSKPSLCNAFIMSPREAEFGVIWRREMENAFDGSWSNHCTILPYELSQKYPDLIHIEPQQSFFKHDYTPRGIYTLLQGCDSDYNGVISMHLWNHLWWSRWRRDFSSFHAGKLTEEHIRKVDTTYNLVARRFLPETKKPLSVMQKLFRKNKAGLEAPKNVSLIS